MIIGGYILQPRIFGNSDASKMPPVTRELWFLLLRGVNHKTNGKYTRGTGFFNLSEIQEKLSWYVGYRKETYSKPQLTKSLRRLCDDNMIETAKATRGVYVTICNYDYYQDPKNYEGNSEGSTKELRSEREGHTKNKNVKNEKKKETPNWLDEKTFKDFKEMRMKKKKPMTDRATGMLFNKLEEFKEQGYDPNAILEQSIFHCWDSVYKPKEELKTEDVYNFVD